MARPANTKAEKLGIVLKTYQKLILMGQVHLLTQPTTSSNTEPARQDHHPAQDKYSQTQHLARARQQKTNTALQSR